MCEKDGSDRTINDLPLTSRFDSTLSGLRARGARDEDCSNACSLSLVGQRDKKHQLSMADASQPHLDLALKSFFSKAWSDF